MQDIKRSIDRTKPAMDNHKKAKLEVLGNLGTPEKQKNKRHIEDQLRRVKEFKERRRV